MTAAPPSDRHPYWACLRLNARLARLALTGRWLGRAQVAAGYDRVAPHYDTAWLRHLRPVTDDLLARLPAGVTGTILDLGCGTGHSTRRLLARYPGARVLGVDLSEAMLSQARGRGPADRVTYVTGDMLAALVAQPARSAALVVSAWALGYSRPGALIRQAARVLVPGGSLAFVVNLADTLAPVGLALRRAMARFPERVARVPWLRFPRSSASLARQLRAAGLGITWQHEARQRIRETDAADAPWLPWLRRTGVLAGFDGMLNLDGPVGDYVEQCLRADARPLDHHYTAFLARRPETHP